MKARLVPTGNSRRVRLPKPFIVRITRPRVGWAEAAKRLRRRGEDLLLDSPIRSRFEQKEWGW